MKTTQVTPIFKMRFCYACLPIYEKNGAIIGDVPRSTILFTHAAMSYQWDV